MVGTVDVSVNNITKTTILDLRYIIKIELIQHSDYYENDSFKKSILRGM